MTQELISSVTNKNCLMSLQSISKMAYQSMNITLKQCNAINMPHLHLFEMRSSTATRNRAEIIWIEHIKSFFTEMS